MGLIFVICEGQATFVQVRKEFRTKTGISNKISFSILSINYNLNKKGIRQIP
jgi:hypothetical protein